MSIKQISVFLENVPGALYAMTGVLAQNKIDMRAFTLAEASDFGIARVIVDDLYKTTTVLKDAGYVHSISDVLGVVIPDSPGGLNRVLQALTDAQVNVEYMYVFLGHKTTGSAYMIFKVADNAAASDALAARGIRTVEQGELEKLGTEDIRPGQDRGGIFYFFFFGLAQPAFRTGRAGLSFFSVRVLASERGSRSFLGRSLEGEGPWAAPFAALSGLTRQRLP